MLRGDLNHRHLKVFLARTALWTSPVHRHIFPQGTRSDTFIWKARLFIVDPATNQTHISFKFHNLFPVFDILLGLQKLDTFLMRKIDL